MVKYSHDKNTLGQDRAHRLMMSLLMGACLTYTMQAAVSAVRYQELVLIFMLMSMTDTSHNTLCNVVLPAEYYSDFIEWFCVVPVVLTYEI